MSANTGSLGDLQRAFQDYLLASSNEIPERWLRAQERG